MSGLMLGGWIWAIAALGILVGLYVGGRFAEVSAAAGWRAFRKSQATVTVLERQLDECQAELNNSTWRTRAMSDN